MVVDCSPGSLLSGAGIRTEDYICPTQFIHQRWGRLIEKLPALQHDPDRLEDVLKVDVDEDGNGGDDAGECSVVSGGSKVVGGQGEEGGGA